jgi:hypothetical protein
LGKEGRVIPCEIADSGLQLVQGVSVAERVEAVAVDTCAVFLESEEPRLRVSGLQQGVSMRRGLKGGDLNAPELPE